MMYERMIFLQLTNACVKTSCEFVPSLKFSMLSSNIYFTSAGWNLGSSWEFPFPACDTCTWSAGSGISLEYLPFSG